VSDTLVLCYHAFSDDWPADLSVRPEVFATQLRQLHAAGYQGVTFTEAIQRQARRREVAVTFDDAFTSVVTHAKPVLDELGWPGTIFTVSDFAATGAPVRWEGVSHWADGPHAAELDSLDWEGLRALRDAGWEVGSHTRTHPHLTQIDIETVEAELVSSREAIEAALDQPCPSIAYPYGDVNPAVVEAAGRAGYATGAALPARWGELGTLEWPRVGVYRPDDLKRFRLKTSRATRRARELLKR
jgi:peptidoglycan/xylan/chitin deacetylase (PgdA/CDA1 family)